VYSPQGYPRNEVTTPLTAVKVKVFLASPQEYRLWRRLAWYIHAAECRSSGLSDSSVSSYQVTWCWGQYISVSTVTKVRAAKLRNGGTITDRRKIFLQKNPAWQRDAISLLFNGYQGISLWDKETGTWSWQLCLEPTLRMTGTIPPLPYVPTYSA